MWFAYKDINTVFKESEVAVNNLFEWFYSWQDPNLQRTKDGFIFNIEFFRKVLLKYLTLEKIYNIDLDIDKELLDSIILFATGYVNFTKKENYSSDVCSYIPKSYLDESTNEVIIGYEVFTEETIDVLRSDYRVVKQVGSSKIKKVKEIKKPLNWRIG